MSEIDTAKVEALIKKINQVLTMQHEKLGELDKKIDRYFAMHHEVRSNVNGLAAVWGKRFEHIASEVDELKAATRVFTALIEEASIPKE